MATATKHFDRPEMDRRVRHPLQALRGYIRGRLHLAGYARQAVQGKPHILPCRWDEFTVDNWDNRILWAAARRLKSAATALGPEAAGADTSSTAEASSGPPKLSGVVERTIVANIPEFEGSTLSFAVQMQDCYEIIQKLEKSYRITLYLGLVGLILALISWFIQPPQ